MTHISENDKRSPLGRYKRIQDILDKAEDYPALALFLRDMREALGLSIAYMAHALNTEFNRSDEKNNIKGIDIDSEKIAGYEKGEKVIPGDDHDNPRIINDLIRIYTQRILELIHESGDESLPPMTWEQGEAIRTLWKQDAAMTFAAKIKVSSEKRQPHWSSAFN